jgi:hypothetical protein
MQMAHIEPHMLWEQNDAILHRSEIEGLAIPLRARASEIDISNEGLMYTDHINPNNARAAARRAQDEADMAAADADRKGTKVLPPEDPAASPAPPSGPQIEPEAPGVGNGAGDGKAPAPDMQWKSNA